MGSGKSAVGKLLARKLGRRFMDTDAVIEARYGRPIAGIFARRGEAGFRCLERRTVRSVSRRRGCVVSMGGGTVLENENWQNMRRSGISVFLSCSFQELWKRLRHTWMKRPLICGAGKSKVRALVDRRRPYYRKADITVSTTKKTPANAAAEIIKRVQAAK